MDHHAPSGEPVGTTVLAGFLGAGKTTLLNRLLAAPHGLRMAVVVNEFGSVGVDGALVPAGTQFVELDNGCLCCALNEDLDATLRQLAARADFDHLLVETTGVADPLPVAWTFSRPGLSQRFRVDAVVTVVDAVNIGRTIAEHPEARDQVERADLLAVSKLDCVADGGIAAHEVVRAVNQVAPVVDIPADELPWQLLLSRLAAPTAQSSPAQPSPAAPPAAGDGPREAAHRHADLSSWSFVCDQVLSDAALEDLLFALPPAVWRVKGLVRTDTPWGWTLVNGVGGRIDIRPTTPPRPGQQAALVFIGRGMDVDALARACAGLRSNPA